MKKFTFSKVKGLEPATLQKLNFFIGIFQGFYCEIYLATFRTAILEHLFSGTPTPAAC